MHNQEPPTDQLLEVKDLADVLSVSTRHGSPLGPIADSAGAAARDAADRALAGKSDPGVH